MATDNYPDWLEERFGDDTPDWTEKDGVITMTPTSTKAFRETLFRDVYE